MDAGEWVLQSTDLRCAKAIFAYCFPKLRDLQDRTGLSWGAISSITAMLCDKGFIVPTGKQRTNVGRKPFQLDINPNDYFIIGVDLNISGLCGVLVDVKGRVIREWMRYLTHNTYDCVMDTSMRS